MKKSEVMLNIGQRIKRRREELGMSQQELAFHVGYKSRSSINKIELGINDMGQKTLQKIAAALGTTSGVLLGEASVTEQLAAETGDEALMAIFEALRTNADRASSAEDPEAKFRLKSDLEAMRKKGLHVSDMLELALNAPDSINIPVSADEFRLLSLCRSMNAEGQEKLIDYADDLASSGKYKKSTSAGMVQNG